MNFEKPEYKITEYVEKNSYGKFELEPLKIHRKLRCSYSSTLPFKFDFTVRYISNKKTLIPFAEKTSATTFANDLLLWRQS